MTTRVDLQLVQRFEVPVPERHTMVLSGLLLPSGGASVPVAGGTDSDGGSLDSGGSGGGAGEPGQGDAGAAACMAGDCCPEDREKTEPGACGCGVADADSDTDMTLDCLDGCPDEAVPDSASH